MDARRAKKFSRAWAHAELRAKSTARRSCAAASSRPSRVTGRRPLRLRSAAARRRSRTRRSQRAPACWARPSPATKSRARPRACCRWAFTPHRSRCARSPWAARSSRPSVARSLRMRSGESRRAWATRCERRLRARCSMAVARRAQPPRRWRRWRFVSATSSAGVDEGVLDQRSGPGPARPAVRRHARRVIPARVGVTRCTRPVRARAPPDSKAVPRRIRARRHPRREALVQRRRARAARRPLADVRRRRSRVRAALDEAEDARRPLARAGRGGARCPLRRERGPRRARAPRGGVARGSRRDPRRVRARRVRGGVLPDVPAPARSRRRPRGRGARRRGARRRSSARSRSSPAPTAGPMPRRACGRPDASRSTARRWSATA